MAPPVQAEERLSNVDVLRGGAALAVCFFHFTREGFLRPFFAQPAAELGYLGVDAFFVISGFVIPLALARAGFSLEKLPAFLLARFTRLYPAFLASLLVVLALWHVSALRPGFGGTAPQENWPQILGNATLTCDALGKPWLIPIYWTLAVEAQYYLVVACTFPLFASAHLPTRLAATAAWLGAYLLVPIKFSILPYSALFGMGIAAFQQSAGLISRRTATLLAAAGLAVQWFRTDLASAAVGFGTYLFIVYAPTVRSRVWLGLGAISYSLYLIHVPVGGRIINLFAREPHGMPIRLAAVALALAASLLASIVFYRLIEKPSHQWSKRFRFRGATPATGRP